MYMIVAPCKFIFTEFFFFSSVIDYAFFVISSVCITVVVAQTLCLWFKETFNTKFLTLLHNVCAKDMNDS